MTDCLQCGLSLQGRDNEAQTCSDCLLGITDESYSTIEGVILQTINQPVKMNKKEILLDPIEMTEELMSHIFDCEFGGELDPNHRFFECYLQLQLLKEKMLKDEEDAYVSVDGESLSNEMSKGDMSVAIYNDEVKS